MESISDIATLITALGVIFGALFGLYRWYIKNTDKQQEQDAEIKKMKAENTLICYGLSACLDGLIQLGCNHSVPEAKQMLDKHLNKAAHDQED